MDRSDDVLEGALVPQTVRTVATRRPAPLPASARAGALPQAPAAAFNPPATSMASMFEARPRTLLEPPQGFIPAGPMFKPIVIGPQAWPAVSARAAAKPAPPPRRWDDAASRLPANWPQAKALTRKALKFTGLAFAAWMALILVAILAYRFVDPPASTLMMQRRLAGESYQHAWVPLSAISPAPSAPC